MVLWRHRLVNNCNALCICKDKCSTVERDQVKILRGRGQPLISRGLRDSDLLTISLQQCLIAWEGILNGSTETNQEAPLISQEEDGKNRTKTGPLGTQITSWIVIPYLWQEIQIHLIEEEGINCILEMLHQRYLLNFRTDT